jgi:hypothetical protein
VKLNHYDTAILDSVWRAFVKVAAEFPDDEGVLTTLQYHGWYSRQCTRLSQRPESPHHEKHITMTPENPGFAAAVRVARRALAERIAARATDKKTPTDTTAAAPVPTSVPPVPGK